MRASGSAMAFQLELIYPCVLKILGLAVEAVQLGLGFLTTGEAAENDARCVLVLVYLCTRITCFCQFLAESGGSCWCNVASQDECKPLFVGRFVDGSSGLGRRLGLLCCGNLFLCCGSCLLCFGDGLRRLRRLRMIVH